MFDRYLTGAAGLFAVAGLIWGALKGNEADHQRDRADAAETSLAAERAASAWAARLAATDSQIVQQLAALREEVGGIELTGEVEYVIPPTPDCPSPRVSTARLRDQAARSSALLSTDSTELAREADDSTRPDAGDR